MMCLACISYSARTVGYVLVHRMGINILLLDLLHGFSYALSQSAGVAYVEEKMPIGLEASGQGLLSLVRGVGASLGLLLGGFLEDNFGAKFLYAILSLLVFMAALLLEIAHYCKRRSEKTLLEND